MIGFRRIRLLHISKRRFGQANFWGALALVAALSGCSMFGGEPAERPSQTQGMDKRFGKFFGGDVVLFGGEPGESDATSASPIGVNVFLWRAALDTLSFMPLASTPDPFGGVIVTDWHSPAETPDERFKVTVYILDRQLRADGLKVSVFHQLRDAAGVWSNGPVDERTATDLENEILARARELRIAAASRAE
jgi:hypothetical protein